MKTTARIASVEQSVKAAFSLADARAALVAPAPTPGNTPAAKIAAAISLKALQDAATPAAERIREGIRSALKSAEDELDAIAREAEAARAAAEYIVGKASELPETLPAHVKGAALALRGQPGTSPVARQLELAAENAEAEVARLRERWLPRTQAAAELAVHKHAARIYGKAGLERKARAAELMADRARFKHQQAVARNSDRRLTNV